ncbi:putative tail assembly chaperone [Xanthomonas phage Mallos]|uniref:Tail assembly chaperone n=1 Tax=Xanthomonas phage Mallos TaxID=2939131 RepID=A0A9E7E1Y5_9CAUD|nr:putative tail assembly chaperone [Xanthomonas phage Mallos]URA07143.1 putative tail assembly chaperone [Xanthomonas phage Mallos]
MSTDKKESTAGGMELFHTRQFANEGIELPLYTPDGKRSEHWMRIRGVDSDEFRLAEAESKRDVMRIAQMENVRDRTTEVELSKLTLIAALVISWSFPQECTRENVVAFLKEAPQIADAIDTAASKRSLFFAARLSSLANTPSTSSDLT